MKIVPFPHSEDPPDEQTLAAIKAALRGEAVGAEAESWRTLRADVRTLAPAMSDEFALTLYESIERRAGSDRPSGSRRRLAYARGVLARMRGAFAAGRRHPALAAGACVLIAIVALIIVVGNGPGSSRSGSSSASSSARQGQPHSLNAHVEAPASSSGEAGSSAPASPSGELQEFSAKQGPSRAKEHMHQGVAEQATPESSSTEAQAAAAGGEPSSSRVQQRAASLTLAPKPEAVQSVADQVAQLTVREGGFVQSSQVHRQSGAGGSAELRLSLPSARLTAALASLGRLAPTREESQSLQDITDQYGAARRKLADAVAERQALLRALARASTQSQIESLHARIALAAGAVTRARTAFGAISRRGSNSTVEVTVLGDAHAGSYRSTLGNGLHDALDVLKAVAVVLLIALAVLVPLALVLALALAWRAARRRLRERALS
jgi:hypothetical protein